MGMKSKTVTGIAENLKAIKDGRNYPSSPMGGTERESFTGSNDPRKSGDLSPNVVLKASGGYIDQAPTYIGDTSFSRKWADGKVGGPANKAITTASEDVTRGMGGKFIGE